MLDGQFDAAILRRKMADGLDGIVNQIYDHLLEQNLVSPYQCARIAWRYGQVRAIALQFWLQQRFCVRDDGQNRYLLIKRPLRINKSTYPLDDFTGACRLADDLVQRVSKHVRRSLRSKRPCCDGKIGKRHHCGKQ